MQRLARLAVCSLALLIVSATATSHASAGCCDLWDLLGTDLVDVPRSSNSQQVEFKDFGIVLEVRPVVNSRAERPDFVFILLDDAIYFDDGASGDPRWEQISEREFRQLIADLEDAGFDLTAEIVEAELLLGVVLFTY